MKMIGSGITRFCDSDVSLLLQNWGDWGCGSSGTGVCISGLLRISGESLLLPVWRSVEGGFMGKDELDAWVVRAVT